MDQISNTYEKLFRMQEQLCSEYEGASSRKGKKDSPTGRDH